MATDSPEAVSLAEAHESLKEDHSRNDQQADAPAEKSEGDRARGEDASKITNGLQRVSFAEPTDNPTQQSIGSAGIAPTTQALADVEVVEDEAAAEKKKKKKKSKKSSAQKAGAAPKPTGFEEFYVDPPVTPQDFVLEQELYDASLPFYERVQTAIQRFTAKRKLDESRRALWVKYMAYGGITGGPKQFGGGGGKNDMPEGATAADIITLKAKEFVTLEIVEDQMFQQEEDQKYVVDFDGVLRAFLSLSLRSEFDVTKPETVKSYCAVIRSWLNYLLHHNVCNEYKNDILAARQTIDLAEKELVALIELPGLLPGTFGAACKAIWTPPSKYHSEEFDWGSSSRLEGLPKEDAFRIFLAAMAAVGTDDLIDLYSEQNDNSTTSIVESVDTGLEITGIFPSTKQVRDMYAHPSNHDLTPMGHITARTWWCPWLGEEDLTEEEEAALPAEREAAAREYVFWLDDQTLKQCWVGMKWIADIKKLSFGVWFIDNVKLMYPSFTMSIANDLMEGWRDHVYLPPKDRRADAQGEPNDVQDPDAPGDGGAEPETITSPNNEKGQDEQVQVQGIRETIAEAASGL